MSAFERNFECEVVKNYFLFNFLFISSRRLEIATKFSVSEMARRFVNYFLKISSDEELDKLLQHKGLVGE